VVLLMDGIRQGDKRRVDESNVHCLFRLAICSFWGLIPARFDTTVA
jgi:hypothetical protein